MIYLNVIVCMMLCVTGIHTEKSILNPLTFFTGLWGTIISLSGMHLFKLNAASTYIYGYIFLGLLSFALGYYSIRYCNKRIKRPGFCNCLKRKWKIRYHLLYIMGIIIILYQARFFIPAIRLLLKGNSLGTIRRLAQDSSSILGTNITGIENFFRIMFIMPFTNVVVFVAGVDFWLGKRDRHLLKLAIAVCVVSLLSSGGRSALINFMICFVVAFSIRRYNLRKTVTWKELRKELKRNQYTFVILLLAVTVILVAATLSRNDSQSTIGLLYYYFAMEPLMLEQWIETVDCSNLLGYGTASLNGFIFPVIYLVVNSLGLNYPAYWDSVYRLTLLTDSEWKIIAGGRKANAYVTAFWFLYLDGRVWGIMLGMMIYGGIMGYLYKDIRTKHTGDIRAASIYVSLFISLFYSFARMQFSNIYYSLALVYLLLLVFKPHRHRRVIQETKGVLL